MAIKIQNDTVIFDNKAVKVGSGTTAQRPSSPAAGRLWFNTDIRRLEGFDGVKWRAVGAYTGRAWAFGQNYEPGGQQQPGVITGLTSDGTSIDRSSPVSVVGGFTDWVLFSRSYGLRANGSGFIMRISPSSIPGGVSDWKFIENGGQQRIGIRSNNTIWSWGRNFNGQLGDNTNFSSYSSPVSLVGGITDWVSASTGSNFSAAIRSNGTAWSWGSNSSGRLGDGTTITRSSPVSVIGGFTDWVQISCGAGGSAGIRANGTAWSWGLGSQGVLGNNTLAAQSSPVSVIGGFTDWVQVSRSPSLYGVTALRSNGTVWAWGYNNSGRVGDGTTIARSSPVSVVGGFTDWVEISSRSFRHTCGIRANGTAWCWGSNAYGELGDNTTIARSSPVSVVGGFTDWVKLSAGERHSMGIRSE